MKTHSRWSHSTAEDFLQQGWFIRLTDGEWVLGWGAYSEQESLWPGDKVGFYVPDFFLTSQKPWYVPEHSARLTTSEFMQLLPQEDSSAQPWSWQEPSFSDFESQFAEIGQKIQNGDLEKAVPVVFASSLQTPSPQDRRTFLQRLAQVPKGMMVYGYWLRSGEGMIGVTPEMLFSRKGSEDALVSMALAGTTTPDGDLMSDPKERHEHQLVIDDIKERLLEWGEVDVGPTHEWNLGSIKHLRTPIKARLHRQLTFNDIIQHLHPTPALGVFPRKEAWDWLKQQPEAQIRRHFGGPFGVQVAGEEELCLVAIRNLQWDKEKSLLGSGCGIVGQSQLHKEWRELEMKRDSFRKVLGW